MIKQGKDLEDYVTNLCQFIQSTSELIRETVIRQCIEQRYEIKISYPDGSSAKIRHPKIVPYRTVQLDVDPVKGVVDLNKLTTHLNGQGKNLQAQVNKALEIVEYIIDHEELVSKGYEPPFEVIPQK